MDLERRDMQYDPAHPPDSRWWASLNWHQRIEAVQAFHNGKADEAKVNSKLHAIAHVIVEDLLASGKNSPVQKVLEKLIAQGLNRHQAIHAIATVILERISEEFRYGDIASLPNCFARLSTLTARGWAMRGQQIESPTKSEAEQVHSQSNSER